MARGKSTGGKAPRKKQLATKAAPTTGGVKKPPRGVARMCGIKQPSARITSHSKISCIKHIESQLKGTPYLKVLEDSCFGHLRHLPEISLYANVIYNVLLQRKYPSKKDKEEKDAMSFNIGNQEICFGEREFAMMSGLKFQGSEKIDYNPEQVRLMKVHFPGQRSVKLEDLIKKFNQLKNSEDKIKLGLLYIAESVIMGHKSRCIVNKGRFFLVDNLEEFNRYPWGKLSFKLTIKCLICLSEKKNVSKSKHMLGKVAHDLQGFPHVFQSWIFHSIPVFQLAYTEKNDDCPQAIHPRILHLKKGKTAPWHKTSRMELSNVKSKVLHPTLDELKEGYMAGFLSDEEVSGANGPQNNSGIQSLNGEDYATEQWEDDSSSTNSLKVDKQNGTTIKEVITLSGRVDQNVESLEYLKLKLGSEIEILKKESSAVESDVGFLNKKREEMETHHYKLLEEKAILIKEKSELRRDIESLNKEKTKLSTDTDLLNKEKEKLECDFGILNKQHQKLQFDFEILYKEKTKLGNDVELLSRYKSETKTGYEILKDEKNKLATDLEFTNKEKDKLRNDVELLNEEKDKLLSDVEFLNVEKAKLGAQSELLSKEKTKLQSDFECLNRKKSTVQGDICSLNEKKTSLQDDICSLNGEKITVQEDICLLNEKKTTVHGDIRSLNENKTTLESEIKSLSNEKSNLENETDLLGKEKMKLQSDKDRLQIEIELLSNEKTDLGKETDLLTKNKTKLECDFEILYKESTTVKSDVELIYKKKTKLGNDIELLSRENSEMVTGFEFLKREKSTVQDDVCSLNEKKASIQDVICSLNEKKTSIQDDICSLNEKKTAIQDNICLLNEKKTVIQDDICSLNEKKTTVQVDFRSLNEKKTVLESEIESLSKEKTNLGNETDLLGKEKMKLQTDIEFHNKEKAEFIHSVTADLSKSFYEREKALAENEKMFIELKEMNHALVAKERCYTEELQGARQVLIKQMESEKSTKSRVIGVKRMRGDQVLWNFKEKKRATLKDVISFQLNRTDK
ncbi:WD repeat-containing protein 87-like [Papaver somniferum]|uniref:WD repeat-containing protein 87-like n=1 Tax=Papaver somniferum TaxID=3469 RepID=UPI000E6F7AE5|nr:WD repeat-containing protein 87-like [Papaver somniferum]